jgi:hypothetical protein
MYKYTEKKANWRSRLWQNIRRSPPYILKIGLQLLRVNREDRLMFYNCRDRTVLGTESDI